MKQVIYVVFLLLCTSAFSQKSDITSAIIALDNQKDLESAKKWIDVATNKIESGANLKPVIFSAFFTLLNTFLFTAKLPPITSE